MLVLRGKAARDLMRLLKIKGANKNGAVGSRCKQGHFHPSKGEARRCDSLHVLQQYGEIKALEVHPSIPLWKGRKYKADFRYLDHGRVIVEDFKGAQSRDFQLVKKAWPNYGRGTLRETRAAGDKFFTYREITGKWKK
jgi:hypothetical protein